MLENGGKTAQYEVTCVFDVTPKFNITVNSLENGTIKAYKMKAGARVELEIKSGILEVEKDDTVYFELVANGGKTPKKLVVDGSEYTSVTTLPKQTPGAIAMKIQIKKAFVVTGECGD